MPPRVDHPARLKFFIFVLVSVLFGPIHHSAFATLPVYDHVVIVIEENERFESVIRNPEAPYINQLAQSGVSFTRMRAVTHPSQPNYLELFSGSNQGIIDDAALKNKFTTPNLGAALLAAGKTFVGYAEGLPAEGDVTSDYINDYTRRHCPWIGWMPESDLLDTNQIPRSLHKPLTAFPSDFTQLPTVAFVIPSNIHNMHSAPIADADTWLRDKLGAYADWARTHNSLLIVTWDEDNFQQANRIPTIFYGDHLQRHDNDGSWSLHNLLRTIEDLYSLPHSGNAGSCPPIRGAFVGERPPITRTFSVATSGGIIDTGISSSTPSASNATASQLTVRNTATEQALIKFPAIFGGSNGVPVERAIISGKIMLTTRFVTAATRTTGVNLHRMLIPWSDASTYSSLSDGVQLDDVEATAAPEWTAVPSSEETAVVFDTTESVLKFATGVPNEGWVLDGGSSSDDWVFVSSEGSPYRPELEVSYEREMVSLDQKIFTVAPGRNELRILVHRFGTGEGALSVNFSTADLSALAGVDYGAVSGTFTWADGDISSREIVIPIVVDSIVKGIQTFRVLLTSLSGDAVLNAGGTCDITIDERPFDLWRLAKFSKNVNLPMGAPDADPDNDGLPNWLEYVYALNPLLAEKVAVTSYSRSGSSLFFIFRSNPSAADITYTVQVSDDLVQWTDGSTYSVKASQPNTSVTVENGHSDSGSARTTSVRLLGGFSAPARYVRLKATLDD